MYQEGMKSFIPHIMRLSGESRAGPKEGPKIPWKKAGKEIGLVFTVVRG